MSDAKAFNCPHCNRLVGDVVDEGLLVNSGTLLIASFVTLRCMHCKRLIRFRPSKTKKQS